MFQMYKRKLVLLALLLAVYTAISFWVPYSKLWFIEDVMHNQARLFFANQSFDRMRVILTAKAEALAIPVKDENIEVKNVHGEIIYLEMRWDEPVDILFYHTSLHFEPKIFGLIRRFEAGGMGSSSLQSFDKLVELSDSTTRFLRDRNLQNYVKDFFAK